jgi:hypothetical protein
MFGWIDANDQISSVDARISGNRPFVILFEHVNMGGSQLWLWGRDLVHDLGQFGWNDRASSLMMMYF